MDLDHVSQQLIRTLRGKSSQRAMSRLLGYSSNVFYTWEARHRSPTASELLRLVTHRVPDVSNVLSRFSQSRDPDLFSDNPRTQVAAFMRVLKGRQSVKAIADGANASRYQVMRWLNGQTEPKAASFLQFIETTTSRVLDFLAMLVVPESLPAIGQEWNELEARRRIAVEMPWSHAILRALELDSYRDGQNHRPGWVAHTIGISMQEEAQCIEALEQTGLIRWNGKCYDLMEATVDTSRAPAKARKQLKRHWLNVASANVDKNTDGLYSYNLMSLSRRDLERLRQLHVDYFQMVRSIVIDSKPECVALVAMQLFELGASAPKQQE